MYSLISFLIFFLCVIYMVSYVILNVSLWLLVWRICIFFFSVFFGNTRSVFSQCHYSYYSSVCDTNQSAGVDLHLEMAKGFSLTLNAYYFLLQQKLRLKFSK